ncbi:MAG: hypothetical protein RLZZ449_832, partial [Actinomycetota bacterium]
VWTQVVNDDCECWMRRAYGSNEPLNVLALVIGRKNKN